MKPGRNDPCPCGSGKKYKKCCQDKDAPASSSTSRQPTSFGGSSFRKVQEINQLIALFNAGRLSELELMAHEVAKRYADVGLIWKLLGLSQMMQGKDAISTLQKAAALLPADAELHNHLGIALTAKEQYSKAETSFRQALKIKPDYAEAYYNLNLAYMAQGRLTEAEKALRQAIDNKPGYAMAHHGLGLVLKARGDLAGAETSLRHALALKPDFAGGHYSLGYLLMEQARTAEAEASFKRAVEITPDYHEARNKLGLCYSEQGRFDDAEANYRQVLASAPDNIDARFNLTMIRKSLPGDDNASAMLALKQAHKNGKKPLADHELAMLDFALGRAFENGRDYDKSFAYYAEGAQRKRATFDYSAQKNTERFTRIAQFFNREMLEKLGGSGNPSSSPIFVLGMPRSGTTLIEQIIASHRDVHGAGELPDLIDVATGAIGAQESLFPQALPALDSEVLASLGAEYLARVRRHDMQAARITDKQPLNFIAIGLIHLMLPNAKIIHVTRNPVDTCLSCFSQLFQGKMEFSYDLAELGKYYADYHALMNHWRNALPAGSFIDVCYEEVVQDPETQAKRLIDYCGLEWDAQCLNFHNSKRTIRTASVFQARQPVYQSSVERWRHYENHLGPLLGALGDLISKDESALLQKNNITQTKF